MKSVTYAQKRVCPKCHSRLWTDGDYVWCNNDECYFGIISVEV
jgi:hypothetical protein